MILYSTNQNFFGGKNRQNAARSVVVVFRLKLMYYIVCVLGRGVHSGDGVGFGHVSLGSVEFRIGYFRIYVTTGRTWVRSVSHGSIEDQLFELSGLHRFDVC